MALCTIEHGAFHGALCTIGHGAFHDKGKQSDYKIIIRIPAGPFTKLFIMTLTFIIVGFLKPPESFLKCTTVE
jgi:hypothetical protein